MNQFSDTLLIIMVIYKRHLANSEAFQSILKMGNVNKPLSLFVYDNSPEPQKVPVYKELEISYKHDELNSGLSAAYNAGARYAKQNQREWILLLDQDTTLPSDILTHYHRAITDQPDIQLFAPILKLQNGTIFSPFIYRFKRGFYPQNVTKGTYRLDRMAPVNSGMMVRVKAFHEVGGYNEKVPLDFSDFQFIERFRRAHPEFCVIDTECIQDFSDNDISYENQANRFRFFCEGARNIEKNGPWDRIQYTYVVLRRMLRLTLRYRKLSFLSIFFRAYLGSGAR